MDLGSLSPKQYFAGGHGKLSVSLEKEAYALHNRCSAAVVSFSLKPGWHVNSAKPFQDYLKPTRVSVKSVEEGRAYVEYPESQVRQLGFQKEPLSLYQGKFKIRVKQEDCAKFSPGTKLTIDIQACSDRVCLAPESLSTVLIDST